MSTSILTVLCTTRFTNTIRQLLKILLAKLGEANVPHIAIVINHHEHSPEAKQKRAKIHKMEEQQYQASCRAMLGSAIQEVADELGFSSHMHALLQDRLHVVDSHSDGESVEDMEALQGLVNWCSSCATINKQAVAADINSLNEELRRAKIAAAEMQAAAEAQAAKQQKEITAREAAAAQAKAAAQWAERDAAERAAAELQKQQQEGITAEAEAAREAEALQRRLAAQLAAAEARRHEELERRKLEAAEEAARSCTIDTLHSNGRNTLHENEHLTCGELKLIMQGDGNLVVYRRSKAVWATNTCGKGCGPYSFIMQSDYNAMIYGDRKATWATNTCGKGASPARFVSHNDAAVAVYDCHNHRLWHAK